MGCAQGEGLRGEAGGATNWAREDQAGNAHGSGIETFNGTTVDADSKLELAKA